MTARFVQGLVEKVQQLEQKLATAVEASQTASTEQEWSSDNHVPAVESQLQVLPATLSWDVDDLVFPTGDNGMVNLPPGQFTNMLDEPETTSFDGELELLSLEATAERYLGPISGLPFAKLTQMVLRHLWPDKAELIFLRRQEPARQQQSGDDAIIPSDILNSFLHNFNDSAVAYPADPTGFSLSGTTNLKDGLGELRLPAEAQLNHLVDFYFAHSHTLYPILNRTEFTTALRDMQQNPQGPVARSPLWLFKIWTVLAIGSTSYCSVTLAEESESMLYYNKAMQYFESALGYGNMAALEVLALQVAFSFFNQLGPNTWFLVGLAARMAVSIGLHAASTYEGMPTDLAERKKRVFFSIYMMDRVVSIALGRPFALHDDDIDVSPFTDLDDGHMTAEGTRTRGFLEPSATAIPLHILRLRRIASKIQKKVYAATAQGQGQNLDEIIQQLHKELIDWRRDTPFPLPDLHPNVPHSSSTWYDFNFYTHLAMLYRPSPLCPTPNQNHLKILAEAAAMSIRQAVNMHRQKRLAYNWLNLLSVFTAAISLIYAITSTTEITVAGALSGRRVIEDLELVVELFDALRVKFTALTKLRDMLQEVISSFKEIVTVGEAP